MTTPTRRVKITFTDAQGRPTHKLLEVTVNNALREVREAVPLTDSLAWKDEEGDLVILQTDEDVRIYFEIVCAPPYRWYAFPRGSSPSPSPELDVKPQIDGRIAALPVLTKPPQKEYVPVGLLEGPIEPPQIVSRSEPLHPPSHVVSGPLLPPSQVVSRSNGNVKTIALPKLNARFVKHATADDESSEYAPGTPFFKTWKFRNDGGLKWPKKIHILFVSKLTGDLIGGPEELPILFSEQVPIGTEVDISVPLVAPGKTGEYTGFWKLADESGKKFGQRVRVRITVVDPPANALTDAQKSIVSEMEDMGYASALSTIRHYLVVRKVKTVDDMVARMTTLGIRMSLN
jgi:hypothetical protein